MLWPGGLTMLSLLIWSRICWPICTQRPWMLLYSMQARSQKSAIGGRGLLWGFRAKRNSHLLKLKEFFCPNSVEDHKKSSSAKIGAIVLSEFHRRPIRINKGLHLKFGTAIGGYFVFLCRNLSQKCEKREIFHTLHANREATAPLPATPWLRYWIYSFYSSFELNLNFDIESSLKLAMNLNVDFQKSLIWISK